MSPLDANEPTLGEVSRGLGRVEREMREGFTAIRTEIGKLGFVPAQVYASDQAAARDRLVRIEESLREEADLRREAETSAAQRAWQSRWSVTLAMIGMPISIIGAVIAALVTASFK